MLQVASMAVHVCQMTGTEEIEACYGMVTTHGAKTLNIQENYGIAVGKPANLIALNAESPYDAIRRLAPVTHVISRGRLLSQTQPAEVKWYGA
jgi:cytosine deaminase